MVAIYSDGITEAENPASRPFDESGLESALIGNLSGSLASIGCRRRARGQSSTRADTRLADDLTILLLRRATTPAPVAV